MPFFSVAFSVLLGCKIGGETVQRCLLATFVKTSLVIAGEDFSQKKKALKPKW